MLEKPNLERDFIPIWKDEFNDLKSLSKSAFILRLIYRSHSDYKTSLCQLSDRTIERMYGLNRRTIIRAKKALMERCDIEHLKNDIYRVKKFIKHQTGDKNTPSKCKTGDKNTPEAVTKIHQKGDKNTPERCQKDTSTLFIDKDIDSVDSKNTPLTQSLKDAITDLYQEQGHKPGSMLTFFMKIVNERLAAGFKPDILTLAIKKAIANNSKDLIHHILSPDNLNSIIKDNTKNVQNDDFKKKVDSWQTEPRFQGTKSEALK